jgi:hypothetical protein
MRRPRSRPRRSRRQCRIPTGVPAVPPVQRARPRQACCTRSGPLVSALPQAARPPRRPAANRRREPDPDRADDEAPSVGPGPGGAIAVPAPPEATRGSPTGRAAPGPTASLPAARSGPLSRHGIPALQRPIRRPDARRIRGDGPAGARPSAVPPQARALAARHTQGRRTAAARSIGPSARAGRRPNGSVHAHAGARSASRRPLDSRRRGRPRPVSARPGRTRGTPKRPIREGPRRRMAVPSLSATPAPTGDQSRRSASPCSAPVSGRRPSLAWRFSPRPRPGTAREPSARRPLRSSHAGTRLLGPRPCDRGNRAGRDRERYRPQSKAQPEGYAP